MTLMQTLVESTVDDQPSDQPSPMKPDPAPAPQNLGHQRQWRAELDLRLVAGHDRTRLQTMRFEGPLRVQRPFYPEGDVCHLYLLHPPGGLVSGDEIRIDVVAEPGSHSLITTPSAGKVYRADSCNVSQRQQVRLKLDQASCEWLPLETVVFDGANGLLDTSVELQGDCRYLGLDVICLGRPASQLPFDRGQIEQQLRIYQDGRPLLLERLLLGGSDQRFLAAAGFAGCSVSGTLVAVGLEQPAQVVETLRESLPARSEQGWFSVTERLGVLIVRYLGHDSEAAHLGLRQCWSQLRPLLLNKPACPPRIWAT